MKDKLFNKKDFILIISILFIAILVFLLFYLLGNNEGASAVVYIDGEKWQSFSLDKDGNYTVETQYGTNIIEITDANASIISSDCPKQVCVHHVSISTPGATIVCLPHHLVLTIEKSSVSEETII